MKTTGTPADSRRARRGILAVLGLATALVVTGVAVTFAAPPAPSAPTATTPPRKTTEVPDPKATLEPVKALPLKPVKRLLSGSLPSSASARGSLVKGFPAAVPLAPGSKVVSSSVSVADKTVQAALDAETSSTPAQVLAYYEKLFAKAGLPGTEGPAGPDSRSMSFVRGTDSVTITVTTTKTGASYSLFGVLRSA
jgi:hypothetical protein